MEPLKLYKLTNEKGQTRNETQWGENVTHETDGQGGLCGPGWLHAFEHPLTAVLLGAYYTGLDSPRMWEAKGEGSILRDEQFKVGVTKLTTIREIPLPALTREQHIRFAIECALEVCCAPVFCKWAKAWLSGKDRSSSSAEEVENATRVFAIGLEDEHRTLAAYSMWAACNAARATRMEWGSAAKEYAAYATIRSKRVYGALDLFAVAEKTCG